MGHLVTYTENEPPATEPGFSFENFVFPDHPQSIEKVQGVTSAEARHLWKCCEAFSKRYRGAIDVGASVGAMTHTLALHYNKVWAFEPWPETFHCLETNSVYFPPCDILLSPSAVGEKNGVGTLWSAHPSRRDAHLENAQKGARGISQEVPVVYLDAAIPEHEPIDMLKVDVEGTELEVLRGAKRLIEKWSPLIYIEAKEEARQAMAGYMGKIGYHQLAKAGHNYLYGANE